MGVHKSAEFLTCAPITYVYNFVIASMKSRKASKHAQTRKAPGAMRRTHSPLARSLTLHDTRSTQAHSRLRHRCYQRYQRDLQCCDSAGAARRCTPTQPSQPNAHALPPCPPTLPALPPAPCHRHLWLTSTSDALVPPSRLSSDVPPPPLLPPSAPPRAYTVAMPHRAAGTR